MLCPQHACFSLDASHRPWPAALAAPLLPAARGVMCLLCSLWRGAGRPGPADGGADHGGGGAQVGGKKMFSGAGWSRAAAPFLLPSAAVGSAAPARFGCPFACIGGLHAGPTLPSLPSVLSCAACCAAWCAALRRLSTIRDADSIAVVSRGHIVEQVSSPSIWGLRGRREKQRGAPR